MVMGLKQLVTWYLQSGSREREMLVSGSLIPFTQSGTVRVGLPTMSDII